MILLEGISTETDKKFEIISKRNFEKNFRRIIKILTPKYKKINFTSGNFGYSPINAAELVVLVLAAGKGSKFTN